MWMNSGRYDPPLSPCVLEQPYTTSLEERSPHIKARAVFSRSFNLPNMAPQVRLGYQRPPVPCSEPTECVRLANPRHCLLVLHSRRIHATTELCSN
jgi:hypothetical protein